MNTTLIAVRHGETEWNRVEKQQGHLNSDLTDLGFRQAKALAEGINGCKIDFFYSSDLGRAIQTASIISQRIGKDFITDDRLRERNLGILQGLTKREFEKEYPDESEKLKTNDPDYRIPGGESIRDRYMRCVDCVEDMSRRHCGKTILIVGHGGVLMSFIHKALNIPLTQKRTYSLFNGSINTFTLSEDANWKLEVWGDISHLKANGLVYLDDN
jgi:probable phosphoglycerate mutase